MPIAIETPAWVRIMADYGSDPLWAMNGEPVGTEAFPMTPLLAKRFSDWAGRYDRLDHSDEDAVRSFSDEGLAVASLLKREFPGTTVVYYDEAGTDKDSRQFEVTPEMAKSVLDSKHWEDRSYFHMTCRFCRAPFDGPKRETVCKACDETRLAPSRPRSVVIFGKGAAEAGVTPDHLPRDVRVLATQYFSGTRNLHSILVGAMRPDTENAVLALGGRFIPDEEMPHGASEAWLSGNLISSAGHPLSQTGLCAMKDAPRDGTPVLLRFGFGLEGEMAEFSGLVIVARNLNDRGRLDLWDFAAPIGFGGYEDRLFQGWISLTDTIT